MIRWNKDRKGMTLMEVLIAGTMGGLILLSLAATTSHVFDAYKFGKGKLTTNRDTAFCVDWMLQFVREAETASQPRTHALLLTNNAGRQTLFEWSGTAGDPLTWKNDTNPTLDLLAGVNDFSFTIQTQSVEQEATVASSEQLVYFDSYTEPETWISVELDAGDLIGIVFTVPRNTPIETIQLTDVGLVLGCEWWHYSDLRIGLYEAYSYDVPRPYGNCITSQDIDNSLIPWADDAGGGEYWLYWETYSLGDTFWIYPNRPYILMLEGVGPNPTCFVRVRAYAGTSPGPDNGIRCMLSSDGGVNWYPVLGSALMDERDVPIDLNGAVHTWNRQTVSQDVSVQISLTIERNGETHTLNRKESLRGGTL